MKNLMLVLIALTIAGAAQAADFHVDLGLHVGKQHAWHRHRDRIIHGPSGTMVWVEGCHIERRIVVAYEHYEWRWFPEQCGNGPEPEVKGRWKKVLVPSEFIIRTILVPGHWEYREGCR